MHVEDETWKPVLGVMERSQECAKVMKRVIEAQTGWFTLVSRAFYTPSACYRGATSGCGVRVLVLTSSKLRSRIQGAVMRVGGSSTLLGHCYYYYANIAAWLWVATEPACGTRVQ